MKKIMSLALLATLVSCGGSGGSSAKKIDAERFEEAALSVERGLVSIESKRGTEPHYSGDMDGNYTLNTREVRSEQYSVILKIDGTQVYKYMEDRDLIEGTVDKSVEVTDFSADSLRQALRMPGARLNGSIFTLNQTQNFDFELDAGTSSTSKVNFSIRVDLNALHCSQTSTIRQTDVKLTQNGVVTTAPDSSTTSTTACQAALSAEQLKALDLSAIEFCTDSTTEEDEVDCEVQNMEHLTDDL